MPRRSALGPEMRAQSRGEWPGSSVILREGFAGLEESVGGGAREEDGRMGLLLVMPRGGRGPRARWAELGAGKGARVGGGRRFGRGGGGIVDERLDVVAGG